VFHSLLPGDNVAVGLKEHGRNSSCR
jgi:hypothetical protein